MMENIEIIIRRKTREVILDKTFLGNELENLQKDLTFTFEDEFVDGQARLEYQLPNGNKNYSMLEKDGESYNIPVKNVITQKGQIFMQLVITEPSNDYELTKDTEIDTTKIYYIKVEDKYVVVENPVVEDIATYYENVNIPVFKSNKFYLWVDESINAVTEALEGYELWIERANAILSQMDNIDIDIVEEDDTKSVVITRKDGSQKRAEITGGGGSGAVDSVNGKTGVVVLTADDIKVKNSQSIQDNLERIDGEIEDIIDNKQDVTLMVNIIDEDNMIIDSSSSEIYNALINGRAVNLVGMNLSLVEYYNDHDDDNLVVSSYYGIGGYNLTIHENQIIDVAEVEFENLNNKEYTLSSSSDKYPSSSAVFNAISDKEIKSYYVTATLTGTNPFTAVFDKTFNEILEAYNQGRSIYLVIPAINNTTFRLASYQTNTRFYWENVVYYSNKNYYLVVTFNTSNEVQIIMTELADKPYVDNVISDKEEKSLNIIATITSLEPIRATFDKTFSDITQAYNQGKQVYLNVPAINNARFLMSVINNSFAVWQQVLIYNGQKAYLYVDIDSNDVVNITITPMASIDYVDNAIGNIDTLLQNINNGGGVD